MVQADQIQEHFVQTFFWGLIEVILQIFIFKVNTIGQLFSLKNSFSHTVLSSTLILNTIEASL